MTRRLATLVLLALAGGAAADELTPEQQAAYDSRYLSVGRDINVYIATDSGAVFSTERDVAQGKYRVPMGEEDFYRVVGRPDLAESYTTRAELRAVLGWGGLAVTLASGILGAADHAQCGPGCGPEWAALAGIGVGLTASAIGMFGIDPHPVDPPTMRYLADQYNQALRRQVVAAPYASAGGGGLSVSGTF